MSVRNGLGLVWLLVTVLQLSPFMATADTLPSKGRQSTAGPWPDPVRRYVAFDTLEQWRQRPEYGYMRTLDSMLRAAQATTSSSGSRQRDFTAPRQFSWRKQIQFLLGFVFLAGLLYIAWRLLGGQSILFGRTTRRPAAATDSGEISVSNADTHLSKARQYERQGEYRLAVRHGFLDLLEQMNAHRQIVLAAPKTNRDYLRELASPLQAAQFAAIVRQYNRVWYGNRIPNSTEYAGIAGQLDDFRRQWLS